MNAPSAPNDRAGRTTGLWRRAKQAPTVSTLVLLALVSLVFVAVPGIDLRVSALFYHPGSGFVRSSVAESVRDAGRFLAALFALVMTLPLVLKLILPDTQLLVRPRSVLFVLLSWLLGPALLVNGVLKEHWGRARPREIVEFGGRAIFTPAWWLSDQCVGNCSFVSGEAASAFWLMAAVFIVPRPMKVPVAVLTLFFATLVSVARMAAGGHFLSDILIAWTLTLLVLVVLDRLVLKGLPDAFDSNVDRSLATTGLTLRRLPERLGRRTS